MDPQLEAKAEVLKDLLTTLQEHDGGRVTPGAPEPKKVEMKQEPEEDPAYDADERLLKLLRGK